MIAKVSRKYLLMQLYEALSEADQEKVLKFAESLTSLPNGIKGSELVQFRLSGRECFSALNNGRFHAR
jgi:hypothetical protein